MVIGTSPVAYVAAASLLGTGYGLTYSAIKGLLATEAPAGLVPQALLLFSLSYFVGVFDFPLVADALITEYGIRPILVATMATAVLNAGIPLGRLLER